MIKCIFRSIVVWLLAVFSRGIIHKYHPIIVMVTGSVGKTSTKDAVAAALSSSFFLRKSEKSYNSEFGVPLTIIGAKNPWDNPVAWLRVFQEALALLFLPSHYPKLLVLEVGADRPGDLMHILHIATPDITVVTRLPKVPVHVEAYATPQAVRDEEFAPAYALPPSAPLIVSANDNYALTMAARLPVRAITYGTAKDANVRLIHVRAFSPKKRVEGMQAKVLVQGETHKLVVRGSVGHQQLAPAAAALAVATALDVSVADALLGLTAYNPPPGRGRVFVGKHDTVIIDDSYNASPASVEKALTILKELPAERRIAVLGDMLELGRYSVEEHERVGKLAAQMADIVVTVGVRSRGIAEAAREAGLAEDAVIVCNSSADAISALSLILKNGDVLLVKGSQNVRTESIVEAFLDDPSDVAKLVRQERQWNPVHTHTNPKK